MSHPPSGTPLPNLILNPGGALPQNPHPWGASHHGKDQGNGKIVLDTAAVLDIADVKYPVFQADAVPIDQKAKTPIPAGDKLAIGQHVNQAASGMWSSRSAQLR
eukprot:5732145-Amphidinium_carterae.1